MTVEEKYRVLLEHVCRALRRYANPTERHNIKGGWPRGELAWAINADLEEAIEKLGEPVVQDYMSVGDDYRAILDNMTPEERQAVQEEVSRAYAGDKWRLPGVQE